MTGTFRHRGLVSGACALAASYAWPAWAHAHDGAHDLHINWWVWDSHAPPMGWFLVDFALFVAALVYWTRKPLSQAFAQRHTSIKRAISDAAAAHAKASQLQQESRHKLAGLETEIRELLETSRQDGEAECAQMVREAEDYARRMRADTDAMMAQEIKRAELRLQTQTMRQVLVQAQSLLQANLKPEDAEHLVTQGIDAIRTHAAGEPR